MKTTNLTFISNSNNTREHTRLNAQELALFKEHTKKISKIAFMFCLNNKVYGVKMPKANIIDRLTVYHDNIVMLLPLSKFQMVELIENGTATYYCTKDELKQEVANRKLQNLGQAIEYVIESKDKVKFDHSRSLADGGDGYRYEVKFFDYGSTKSVRVIEEISKKM